MSGGAIDAGSICVDVHSHLDLFQAAEVEAMVARAGAARVLIVSAGSDLESSRRGIELARRYPCVYACAGFHPLRLEAEPTAEDWRALTALARDARLVAIGEVGLDWGRAPRRRDHQLRTLARALEVAAELGLSVVLHVPPGGDEDPAALDLVARHRRNLPGVVVHYFTGDAERARRWLELGALLSFGKPITRPIERRTREAARLTPPGSCLLETDSYPLPGRTTQPADVRLVARALAELHRTTGEVVARVTTANAARVFPRLRLD